MKTEYRVIRSGKYLCIREVFYNDDETIRGWLDEGIDIIAIRSYHLGNIVKKIEHALDFPILNADDIKRIEFSEVEDFIVNRITND